MSIMSFDYTVYAFFFFYPQHSDDAETHGWVPSFPAYTQCVALTCRYYRIAFVQVVENWRGNLCKLSSFSANNAISCAGL